MPFTITAGVIAAGTAAYNLYDSYQQREAAQNQLDQAKKRGYLENAPTPELQRFYSTATNDVRNARGYSPAEKAQFKNNLSDTMNTQFYNANRGTGGSLSRYISQGLKTRETQALNQFAANDAGLRTRNRNSALNRQQFAVSQIQSLKDRNVQSQNYRQQLLEQALGGAIAQQKQNQSQTISTIGNLGFTGLGYGMNGGGQNPDNPYRVSSDPRINNQSGTGMNVSPYFNPNGQFYG